VNNRLTSILLSGLLLVGEIIATPGLEVKAQASATSTGSLIVTVTSGSSAFVEGQGVSYTQVSHDFLTGYDGPLPNFELRGAPYDFNLKLDCIPWVEIEPHAGYFPHDTEEDDSNFQSDPAMTTGNDCLLYFGEDARDDLPEDLNGLDFDALLKRARPYLEHAVKYEATHGISLFVIKEPAYPGANLLNLTVSQWSKLVKLACQTIREYAPQASIVIEIIPQYLPSHSYKPYTFLDDLIRDGVGYDGIMMVFSPPVSTRSTKEGYPDIAWTSAQVDVFSDLGKQLLVRFSGVTEVNDEATRQTWLEEMYSELFSKETVIGIYWDETLRFPAKLIEVTWPPTPTAPSSSTEITVPMLAFIQDHTTSGMTATDANGQVVIYGYAGEYEIQVAGIPGVIRSHIYRGEERRLDVALENEEATTTTFTQRGGPTNDDGETSGKAKLPKQTIVILLIAATFLLGFGYYSWKKFKKAREGAPKYNPEEKHEQSNTR
jgi:hypothetical protein